MAERADQVTGTPLYLVLDVVYWVLSCNAETNVPLARLQAQHQLLNAAFGAVNADLAHMPTSGPYAYGDDVGNPRVAFRPADYTALDETRIRRVQVPCDALPLDGLAAVDLLLTANGLAPEAGVLNLFVTRLRPGLLGQAHLFGDRCVVSDVCVGGPLAPGALPGYHLGKPAVHEVAHCLGLPHPWDNACALQPFADVPQSKFPNFTFRLYQDAQGAWQGAHDNRELDCRKYTWQTASHPDGPLSCLDAYVTGAACAGCAAPFEQAMNHMDYERDAYSLMFSRQQAAQVRQVLMGGLGRVDVQEHADTWPVPSSAGRPALVPVPVTRAPDAVARVTGAVGAAWPWWAIVVAVVGGAAVLAAVAAVVVWARRRAVA